MGSLQECRREKGKEEGASGEEEGIQIGCKEGKEELRESKMYTELEKLAKHPSW